MVAAWHQQQRSVVEVAAVEAWRVHEGQMPVLMLVHWVQHPYQHLVLH